jgi:aspartate aminotransferase-like enzyme
MANIYDVSKAAGVSIATVSRVLNGSAKVAEATRQQVIEAVQALDYHPNALARSLVHKSTETLALIVPDISNPFFPEIARGVEDAASQAGMPRYYFDFAATKRYMEKDQTPYTPAVSLLYGLQATLRMIREEGLEDSFARHARLAAAVRAGAVALGLRLLADPEYASNSVTSIYSPEGVDPKALRQRVRQEFNVVLAGGQGKLLEKIFRIGHLGYVGEHDVIAVLSALERSLARMGFPVAAGAAVAAAERALAE